MQGHKASEVVYFHAHPRQSYRQQSLPCDPEVKRSVPAMLLSCTQCLHKMAALHNHNGYQQYANSLTLGSVGQVVIQLKVAELRLRLCLMMKARLPSNMLLRLLRARSTSPAQVRASAMAVAQASSQSLNRQLLLKLVPTTRYSMFAF